MLVAEDGGTFRMTIEPTAADVRVSWTITQGDGAAALTESDTFVAPSVEEARRWAHKAARARGFKTIRVKKKAAAAA
ncbi:MAG: hypothetical protein HY060_26010 [Proteobacteria bacterium]|nr:hypothetical protein [Pseudomonadota bacterium]